MLAKFILTFGASPWNPRGKYRLYKILAKCFGTVKGVTPFGVALEFRIDDFTPYYFFRRDYEGPLLALINGLPPSGVFVDVGANVGNYSVLAARRCGDKGVVVAFEPVAETYSRLVRHVAMNEVPGVVTFNAAVGRAEGVVQMVSGEDSGLNFVGGGATPAGERGPPTRMVALDDCLPALIGEREIDLMKIDVEGAELGVLQGAERLLRARRVKRLFVEIVPSCLTRFGTQPEDIWEFLEQRGYRPRFRIPDTTGYNEIFDRVD